MQTSPAKRTLSPEEGRVAAKRAVQLMGDVYTVITSLEDNPAHFGRVEAARLLALRWLLDAPQPWPGSGPGGAQTSPMEYCRHVLRMPPPPPEKELPNEVWDIVFGHIAHPPDRHRLARTCKSMCALHRSRVRRLEVWLRDEMPPVPNTRTPLPEYLLMPNLREYRLCTTGMNVPDAGFGIEAYLAVTTPDERRDRCRFVCEAGLIVDLLGDGSLAACLMREAAVVVLPSMACLRHFVWCANALLARDDEPHRAALSVDYRSAGQNAPVLTPQEHYDLLCKDGWDSVVRYSFMTPVAAKPHEQRKWRLARPDHAYPQLRFYLPPGLSPLYLAQLDELAKLPPRLHWWHVLCVLPSESLPQ